jgi:hypothetical protein
LMAAVTVTAPEAQGVVKPNVAPAPKTSVR